MMKQKMATRLPAEWEPQDAILLAWPHRKTDWAPMLEQVESVYMQLVRQISRFESIIIVAPETETIRRRIVTEGIDLSPIFFRTIETNDTWTRDYGPLTVFDSDHPLLLNFRFNGWGQKFAADKDDQVTTQLYHSGAFKTAGHQLVDLVLEGGSIEVDGHGTLLTTSRCLLNQNRNPQLGQRHLEALLAKHFDIDHFLWLEHGWLAGDDTDAHIDTLARLCPDDTIVYVHCDQKDDEHYSELNQMEKQLRGFKTRAGQPFHLLPLPWPKACYEENERLPATYANFLVVNKAVLVPTYQDPADILALKTIGEAYPAREIIGIDCRPLIKQHGSLHCISMQLPRGVFA